MQFPTIFRILGVLLMLFSVSMLAPIFVAQIYDDGAAGAFLFSFLLTLLSGFLLWFRFRHFHQQFRTRDGFLIVGLFWMVLSLYGAIPLFVLNHAHNSFTDAIFESVSGLTTTGATIISGIDFLPHALQFYRQELQFLGGMGIIVLAVAVLPMLGIGGMQLYRADTPGPMKNSKLTPRITETAKALWLIYVGLNIACIVCYWLAGMGLFDAICEAFSTISTGGFSLHDTSFTYYNSNKIDLIAIIFMLLGGTNFALHFIALRNGNISCYWRDTEFRFYLAIIFSVVLFAIIVLALQDTYTNLADAIVKPMFMVVSFATTTGFYNTQYNTWPAFLTILIMFVTLIGACGGSTTGGAKMVRFVLLGKQSMRELKRLLHPRAVYNIKFGKRVLPENVVESIWGFMAAYLGLLVILMLLLLMTGLDLTTAFSVIVATIANAGAALGTASEHFGSLTPFAKWVCIFAMLAGRLEVFSLLILFLPSFWKE